MGSLRTLLGASQQVLSSRLAHLQQTLETLTERIRGTVARVIGDNVGEVVCETLRRILETTSTSPKSQSRYRYDQWDDHSQSSPWWDEEDQHHFDDYHHHRQDWDESYADEMSDTPVESKPSSQSRVNTAVATGLRAAAWWIRHWWGRFSIVGAITIGVIAFGSSFALGAVAAAGLVLLETIDQIAILKQAATAGHHLTS